jgi:hypothetical protein
MRKIYMMVVLTLFAAQLWAQTASQYIFSQVAGTYTEVTTGGTVLSSGTTGADNVNFTSQPIGFTFDYLGSAYTTVGVSTNGYIWFGSGATATSLYTPISAANIASSGQVAGVVSALARDMLGRTASPFHELRIATIGTAPNRVFVVQFKNWRASGLGTTPQFNFQIRLFEGTNAIELGYGTFVTTSLTASSDYQIGLRGAVNTDFRAVQANAANWANASLGIFNNSNSTLSTTISPASGTTFRFDVPTPCSGSPAGGTAASSGPSVCTPTTTFTLFANGGATGTGLSYQWQSSPDNIQYTDISGATTENFLATQSAATWYRRITTCTNTNQSSTSTPIQVLYSTPVYAALPFSEGFEGTWQSICATRDIPSNNWRNTPTFSDSSWRRDDDGVSANWNNPTSYIYSPTASEGARSARFHSGNASSSRRGSLDLYLDCSAGAATKQLSYSYINTSGSDSLRVWLSTDGGATFERIGNNNLLVATWTSRLVSFTSTSATTILRFQATADFGSTDIGIDNITVTAPQNCSGAPAGGTTTASIASACSGVNIGFRNTGYQSSVGVNGLSYQWEVSVNNGANWTAIASANNPDTLTATQTVESQYRLAVTCAASSTTSYSNVVIITQNANNLPAYQALNGNLVEDFEQWIANCYPTEIPRSNVRLTPQATDSAWRRNDQGTSANWTNPTFGAYTPASRSGNSSARFHSYNAANRTRGFMDFYIDFSGSASPNHELGFYFINTSGADSLRVLYSADGGATFTRLGTNNTTASSWTLRSVPFAASSATGIIRFEATSDYGTTDIGVDSFYVKSIACVAPTALAVSNITTTTATIGWTAAQGVNSYQYEVRASGAPGSGATGLIANGTVSAITANITGLTASTNYIAYVRSNCGGTTSSWINRSFATSCEPYAGTDTATYVENFDNVTAPAIPNCITVENVNGNNAWSTNSSSFYLIGGTNSMTYVYNSTSAADDWFFTAPLTLEAGTSYSLRFRALASSSVNLFEKLEVKFGQGANAASMTSAAIYSNTNLLGSVNANVSFSPTTTGVYHIGFRCFSDADKFYLSVDSIRVSTTRLLPVSITSFTGAKKATVNELSWVTANEVNNAGFTLQRSVDGRNFPKIGFVATKAANGNSNGNISYSFTDVAPIAGTNYYRLQQQDKDGKTSYSAVVTLQGSRNGALALQVVYPNPVESLLNTVITSPKNDRITLVVMDLAGKVLLQNNQQLVAGDNNLQLQVGNLTSGTYLVKAICADGCETMVKQFIKK